MPTLIDPSRTSATQPYRTTSAAQLAARGVSADQRPRILLYTYRGTWIADMSQATDADEIRRLCGTDQIPTPHTDAADWRDVQRAIETRNPAHAVLVDILSRQDIAPADVRPLADVLSRRTRATIAALAQKGGRS